VRALIISLIFIAGQVHVYGQNEKAKRAAYINRYAPVAIAEMKRTGIPASITLAQGMLESDCGYSSLAREGNNHFGIKCHNTWKGDAMYHDDDKKNECFRKYATAEESFRDHSDFIAGTKRYAELFELNPYDYKGWAKGLKKCGYATHPQYAEMLIRLIEEEKLYEFDRGVVITRQIPVEVSHSRRARQLASRPAEEMTIRIGRQIYSRNRIDYIIVQKGDTYDKLCKELDLLKFELKRYNELPDDYVLKEGDILYLQPKRRKAEHGYAYHTVKEGETMHAISQLYGIKLKCLYRMNRMNPGTEPLPGTVLYLRKKKKEAD